MAHREQPEHAIPGEPWCPALPDFGKGENEILEIDNGRFYGYNKAILVAEYMKKVRWIFLSE